MNVKQIFSGYDPRKVVHDRAAFCAVCSAATVPRYDGSQVRSACPRCGYVEYRNPSPGVSVLIYKNDRVLIGKRSPGSFEAGKWCMPCGFVEYDEDFLSAASRETREECGLVVQLRSIIGVTCNFLAPSLHSIVVVFLAQPAGGTLAAGDDLVELQWAPMAGPFPELAFEADREIINRFAASPMQGLPIDSRFEANAQSDPVLTGIIKALL